MIAQLKEALKNQNVRAFLRAIRLGEGTSGDNGYNIIVGGGRFDSFSSHPNQKVYIPKYKVTSTAAGAYQIIYPTWKLLVNKYGFQDFTPQTQDEAAVALIIDKSALDEVIAGKIEKAIQLCSPVWASLPGSKYGQRTEKLERVIEEYKKYGGKVS